MSQSLRPPASLPVYPKYPTIIHALAKAAELTPDAPGFCCEARELTYSQYARAVAALAAEFGALGARQGERIAFITGNGLDAGVGMLAGMAAGAQISPLNPNYTETELE